MSETIRQRIFTPLSGWDGGPCASGGPTDRTPPGATIRNIGRTWKYPTSARYLNWSCDPVKRILLSVPHMSGHEQTYVNEAFASNWLSTVGPNLTAFEQAFERRLGLPAVALASGTAA